MSVQSRQALRLLKFVAEMKKHNYPNAQSFAELLRKMRKLSMLTVPMPIRSLLEPLPVACIRILPVDLPPTRKSRPR